MFKCESLLIKRVYMLQKNITLIAFKSDFTSNFVASGGTLILDSRFPFTAPLHQNYEKRGNMRNTCILLKWISFSLLYALCLMIYSQTG